MVTWWTSVWRLPSVAMAAKPARWWTLLNSEEARRFACNCVRHRQDRAFGCVGWRRVQQHNFGKIITWPDPNINLEFYIYILYIWYGLTGDSCIVHHCDDTVVNYEPLRLQSSWRAERWFSSADANQTNSPCHVAFKPGAEILHFASGSIES